ncbi:MAG: hypothetical protein K1X74_16595 [Pirellulales bacterium]|nr:hypothetical protein [Pirellulales bacterium]
MQNLPAKSGVPATPKLDRYGQPGELLQGLLCLVLAFIPDMTDSGDPTAAKLRAPGPCLSAEKRLRLSLAAHRNTSRTLH